MDDEGTYYDELTSTIQESLEELRDDELPQALADSGELGELAKIEADNRGWTVERTIEHNDGMTTVSVQVLSKGDDDESEDE